MGEPTRVRVLLLSPRNRLLLIKYQNIGPTGVPRPCWTTAGGGRGSDESVERAALREISEETGLSLVRLGPVVWYGEDGQRSADWKITFEEHFILAFAPTETISDRGWTKHERNQIVETRWWTIEELRRTTETIYPVGIADLLEPLLSGNYPDEIIKLPPI
jgi:8-oxo-dGTP pyrophosphatase MutT (NUDIX family)